MAVSSEVAPVGCAKSVAMARPELWVRPARHGKVVDAVDAAAADDDDADVASAAAVGAVVGGVGDGGDDDGGGGKSDSLQHTR